VFKRFLSIFNAVFDVLFLLGVSYMVSEYYNDAAVNVNPVNAYESWKKQNINSDSLHSGDLIMRDSRGFFSQVFRLGSQKEKLYSHSGVIIKDTVNGQVKVFVYHSVGGEENVTNKMKKDPIEIFCSPESNYAYGIYRYILPQKQINIFVAEIKKYYKQGMEFDLSLDLTTDNKMYCSEVIYKSLLVASKTDTIEVDRTSTNKPYIPLDKLYLNKFTKKIVHKEY
jgi:Permuted papain-like amidase enzyme, YaeF/YiiX, C92 family